MGGILVGHCPFRATINESLGTAYLSFQNNRCFVDDGCFIDIAMTIMPNPKFPREKVTTIAYSMAFVLGENRDRDWIVRYEYEKEVRRERILPARSHIHVNAANEAYEKFARSRDPGYSFDRLHFPSFRVSVEQFLAWMVGELSIPTQCERQEALSRLTESHLKFVIEKRTHFG